MDSGDKWLDIVGLLALFVVFFLAISLLTYSPTVDPPTSSTEAIHNAGGKLGAYISHYLYLSVGPLCWFVVFLFGIFTLHLFQRRFDFLDATALVGWGLTFVGLAGLLAWSNPDSSHLVQSYLMSRSRPLFGPAGSFLLFAFTTIVGVAMKPASVIARSLADFGTTADRGRNYLTMFFGWIAAAYQLCRTWFDRLVDSVSSSSEPSETPSSSPVPKTGTSPESTGENEVTQSVDGSSENDSDSSGESEDDDKVLPFQKNGSNGKGEASVADETGDGPDSSEDDGAETTEASEETETADETEDSGSTTSEDGEDSTEAAETQSPEDTEKTKDSDPIEVNEDRPQVDEADMSYYERPNVDILKSGSIKQTIPDQETLDETAQKLEETFQDFGLEGEVIDANPGPVLTMYEVEPGAGVSVKKFESRADDIKLNLAVESVRIVSPIPGKSALGIEVPNDERALVRLREVLESDEFQDDSYDLPLGLGLDVLGDPMVVDLATLPHLLVAGATGSGKSVGLNSMICSLLYRLPPDELKFIMVDPKRVELKLYDGLPHLMTPVIDDTSEATKVLKWAVREMENRYEKLSEEGMRDIASYNEKVAGKDGKEKIPYLVVIVDELSDLMLTNPKECEQAITRLAQMARAVGIHMILATQRPSTDVITGLIKANMPARLAFRVSSGTDSRVILDENGAETLLGNGDLLYLSSDSPHPERGQGSFLSDEETKDLIKFTKEQLRPSYVDKSDLFGSSSGGGNFAETRDDEHYEDAKKLVIERQKASASMLQRRFRVGYNRAARMIDAMEEEGVVGPHRGSKARNVLVDADEYFDEASASDD